IRIERFAETFYVSDSRSSNGTTLNGARINESVIIKNGDRLNLGDSQVIDLELVSDEPNANVSRAAEMNYTPNVETSNNVSPNVQSVSAAPDSNSIPTAFFWLAPVFGLIILGLVGGFFLVISGKQEKDVGQTDDVYTPPPRSRTPKSDDSPTDNSPTPKKSSANENSTGGTSATPAGADSLPTPKVSADLEKVEQNASTFLRHIAQNDSRAFLTGKQSEIVSSKINQFKGSTALAENIKAVKKNAAQFETLANSKDLKAQFLATAALARIGNNRGDPLAVAQTILPILNELKITLDNKLASDNLLIIAAFERGAAGKPRSLQSVLEALSKKTPNVSPREIRTIWFLKENDKITDAEYNFALQFLAIGVITQNPKDFNVNADALTFN
ncbi:MAG: FHA domain-containing protein, partial [Pyrinomonadaceae bacterium]|nr:FHA domain-containing protein [Pyrinomonadaceae bacterium]